MKKSKKKIRQLRVTNIIPVVIIVIVITAKKYGNIILPKEGTPEGIRLQEILHLIGFYGLYVLSFASLALGVFSIFIIVKDIYKQFKIPKSLRDFNVTFILFVYLFGAIFISCVGIGLLQLLKNNGNM